MLRRIRECILLLGKKIDDRGTVPTPDELLQMDREVQESMLCKLLLCHPILLSRDFPSTWMRMAI